MPAFVICPKCKEQIELPLRDKPGAILDMDYKPFKCKKCGAKISNDQMLAYEIIG